MRALRTRLILLFGLPALVMSGCASVAPIEVTAGASVPALSSSDVYAVYTPTSLWVGDALGMHVLASHDPEIAVAIAGGPDESGAFWLVRHEPMLRYATVPEFDD